jgi:hypothetical protein
MARTRHIKERAFNPDQVERLTAAYEGALATLQITDRNDPLAEEIARKIIEVSAADERCTPGLLYARALAELGLPAPRYFPAGQ